EEPVAALPAGDGAAAQAVPRAGGIPLAHERLRRPRQRLDAHRRPHRLPRHRHSRLLARHQDGSVWTCLGPVADAGPLPARDPSGAVPVVRSPAPGGRVNPRPWGAKLGLGSLMLLATVYCLFPIYFMLVQSLKTPQEDVFGNPFIVVNPTLENFEELFERK